MNQNATRTHKDMILRILWDHMSQETRQILMLEVPAAYNDICGGEYVRVHRACDGLPVIRGFYPVTRMTLGGDVEQSA